LPAHLRQRVVGVAGMSRVATQVVRNLALKAGSALKRAAADMSGGVARIARISAAVSPVSFLARFVK
jgi:hypothetical protein